MKFKPADIIAWHENKVVVFGRDQVPTTHSHCVDVAYTDAEYRYGAFNQLNSGWRHIPIDQFPPEFRVHLLLLGVV